MSENLNINPVVLAQITKFSEENEVNELSISDKFEIYSIYSILNGGLGEDVNCFDAHLKGDEFGIDGVSILLQGELVCDHQEAFEKLEVIKNPEIKFIFFQSKIGSHYDWGDISRFFAGVMEFFESNTSPESDQISDLIKAKNYIYDKGVSHKNPDISLYYITTGNYQKPYRIESLIKDYQDRFKNLSIFNSISIKMIGASDLQKMYRSASSSLISTIDYPNQLVMPDHKSIQEAYIGYIKAKEILNLISIKDDLGNISDINKTVFFDNIRDYDEKSKINISINNSLKNKEGGDFIFRNNGITVVCKNIKRTRDSFTIEDYQIVNGCQTSNIIYYNKEIIDDVYVPFRLICSQDENFVSSIIYGTNRQNPVKEEQFWALRPFMKSFEEYCDSKDDQHRIFFERRENQYRSKNIEKSRIIQPSALMKAVISTLLKHPNRSARDYRAIISEYSGLLFQDDHSVGIYYASCYLHYRMEFLWRNQKISSSSKIYRYYIMMAISIECGAKNNILSAKKKEKDNYYRSMLKICDDEDVLKGKIEEIEGFIENMPQIKTTTTREKLRDNIRSEQFAKIFEEEIIKNIEKV
ncbi:AIPR family protein [Acetobacter persici]|uniref:AIPR family protein n=1 Tax=Acetobacter persici TaxID=1076596 RepID=UPI0036D9743B